MHSRGLLFTGLGVLAVSPDGLLLRLVTTDVLTTTFWRGLFYSAGMLVLLTVYYRRNVISAFFNIGRPGLLMMLLYCLGNLAFVYSISHTAVANTLFIISATPLFAALIAWLVYREKVLRRTWIAIAIACAGIAIICSGKSIMPGAWLGNLAALFTAFAIAASFTIVSKNRDRDMLPAMALGGFLTALVLEPLVSPSLISDHDLFILVLMGFFMLPVAASLMYIGPKYISAPEVGLMILLESVFGPLWVWMALGEHPGNLALLGGGIILVTLSLHAYIGMRDSAQQDSVET
jgi:drug/metabolite transporter (DMT)-like permease